MSCAREKYELLITIRMFPSQFPLHESFKGGLSVVAAHDVL